MSDQVSISTRNQLTPCNQHYRIDFAILRNRFICPRSGHPIGHQAADLPDRAFRPCRPAPNSRTDHVRLSVVQTCASAFPWASSLHRSGCQAPTQAAAGWCRPVVPLGHGQAPAATHRPACDTADRQTGCHRTGSLRAARILSPGRETTPAARRSAGPFIPERRGIPSVATRRHGSGFGS